MGLPNCLSWGLEGSYKYDPSKETITDIERVTKTSSMYIHVSKRIDEGTSLLCLCM